MQKQFEKSFDIPHTADVELMACYITPAHMLVVEIPLNHNQQAPAPQPGFLTVNPAGNDGRRLSFSLNKFNTLNSQGAPSAMDSLSALPPPGQQLRRTSITKTTTTTTGAAPLSPEVAELLRSVEVTNGGAPQAAERRPSNAGKQQIIINAPPPSSNNQTSTHTILSSAGKTHAVLSTALVERASSC